MIFCLFFHSCIVVLLLLSYSRWLDEETLADLCLYSLVVELALGLFNVTYIFYTDSIFFLHCGSILPESFFLNVSLVFCFDEVSGFFFSILDFALILCFYFLIEYFEYDSNSVGIILLSSLFSHFALWYFCVFDLFLLVTFWEAISLISFLLIQHWSYRLPTYKAGIKVFFVSQVGDVPFFGFIFLALNRFGTSDLTEILSQLAFVSFDYVYLPALGCLVSLSSLLALCLSSALLLKSAQFFFYPWLLDAMEAPVPISAQLHSSTLVIIGFYCFLRFQNLFLLAPGVSNLLLGFGVLTVVGASVLGFFQEDGKKLLACSTASQLGYAVTGLALFYFEEALILLAFCCCNKAFTFIWFGTLMDRHSGVSDFRFISGAAQLSVLEHAGMLVSLSNFTILPGAFSWHVKSLFLKGSYPFESPFTAYALDVLSLTWFFSSLYLLYLYLVLFLKPVRSLWRDSSLPTQGLSSRLSRGADGAGSHLALLSMLVSPEAMARFATAGTMYFKFLGSSSLGPSASRRMSTAFFYLLLLCLVVLLSANSWFFSTHVDMQWAVDTFYFSNFVFGHYYG